MEAPNFDEPTINRAFYNNWSHLLFKLLFFRKYMYHSEPGINNKKLSLVILFNVPLDSSC